MKFLLMRVCSWRNSAQDTFQQQRVWFSPTDEGGMEGSGIGERNQDHEWMNASVQLTYGVHSNANDVVNLERIAQSSPHVLGQEQVPGVSEVFPANRQE